MTKKLNHLWMNDYLPKIWPTYGISCSFTICRCCCGPGDWVKIGSPNPLTSCPSGFTSTKYWWSTGVLERV